MALTAKQVKAVKPADKAQKLTDGRGMFLYVSPAGGKWWRLSYRFHGKQKTISLGTFPDISLAEARDRRDAYRKMIANGEDPSEQRKNERAAIESQAEAEQAAEAERAATAFELIAREWFERNRSQWVEAHGGRILRRLERDVFPYIGEASIGDLKPPQVLEVVRRIEDRGAIETAHRALQNLGQIFRYAVATGRAERDICVDLRDALPPAKPTHHAAVTDPAELGPLLRAIDGYHGTAVVRAALRLAPLVFVRPGELRRAEWAAIDLEAAEWRFTASKTQIELIVPLARQSLAILEEQKPLTGAGRYVVPNPRSPKGDRPMSENAVLVALRSLGIPRDQMTGHGFRATARTILDEVLGYRPDLIEHQLGHAVRGPLGRAYNRATFLDERRAMMQGWADYLDRLRAGG